MSIPRRMLYAMAVVALGTTAGCNTVRTQQRATPVVTGERQRTDANNESDISLRLPSPPGGGAAMSAALRVLEQRAAASNYGAAWRAVGDRAVQERRYDVAADAYHHEAAVYRQRGDINGAAVEEAKAGRYSVQILPFVRRSANDADRRHNDSRAVLEPALGCFLGAFIDRDDALLDRFQDENFQTHANPDEFEKVVANRHASYFMYMAYGQPFPWRWCETLRRNGQIPHIAWEPSGLNQVRDDDYLESFARDCGRFDAPLFLRFASEMNGKWTPYHNDPADYRRAFRTVAAAIHSAAPKTAMMWCPNAIPVDNIPRYYPGDDAVDWVGVNLYSVMFYDNDPRRTAHDDPADLLRPVYNLYSNRKPIAVGEWAASHRAAVDNVDRPDFAADKIMRFYAALPRLFPRVKLVSWYDANNMRHARADRQLNDYQLTSDPHVLAAYTTATADPWYVGRDDESANVVYDHLTDGRTVSGQAPLSLWARTPMDRTRVYWEVDGRVRFATAHAGPAEWTWDSTREHNGPHRIAILVYDHGGRFVGMTGVTVRVRN